MMSGAQSTRGDCFANGMHDGEEAQHRRNQAGIRKRITKNRLSGAHQYHGQHEKSREIPPEAQAGFAF